MATAPNNENIPAAAPVPTPQTPPHVDWPAAIAGALLATAISFVLMSFGIGIGLSFTSPEPGEGLSPTTALVGTGLWVLWVTVSAFMAGAYLAGRLRRRVPDASEHEVDVRDGCHGLIVWAVGVGLGAVLLAAGAFGTAQVGSSALLAAAQTTPDKARELAYRRAVDALLRTDGKPLDNRAATAAEVQRVLERRGKDGSLSDADKAYLGRVLAAGTGLTDAQAQERIAAAGGDLTKAEKAAADAAEAARKLGIFASFLLAASLLVGAAGAWWSAGIGGRHRDEQTVFAFWSPRRQP